jgi:hypothetical protein
LVDELEVLFRSGETIKGAARHVGVPKGVLQRWFDAGEENVAAMYAAEGGTPSVQATLFLRCEKARAEYVSALRAQLDAAGAGKDSSPGAAGWQLERLEADEFGTQTRLEIAGKDGAPIVHGGVVIGGLTSAIALARELGLEHHLGLDPGLPRGALPPAQEVLPDHADSESSNGGSANAEPAAVPLPDDSSP